MVLVNGTHDHHSDRASKTWQLKVWSTGQQHDIPWELVKSFWPHPRRTEMVDLMSGPWDAQISG